MNLNVLILPYQFSGPEGIERKRERETSSMQKREAAQMKVAGTTIQLQSSQRMMGRVRCQRTRNLEVRRVYERGIGMPMSCSQTSIPSWKQDNFDSCIIVCINNVTDLFILCSPILLSVYLSQGIVLKGTTPKSLLEPWLL